MTEAAPGVMRDPFDRTINYLRLSLTDRCNYRCLYCMPASGAKKIGHEEILRYEEILEIVEVAVKLGVTKIRFTGGEPLVKRGIVKLVREIGELPGIKTLAMTTNGSRLVKYAKVLKQSGINRLNISLDSLNPTVFSTMTRVGRLDDVLAGIDAAIEHGFPVKLNTVLVKGHNDGEVADFIKFAKKKQCEIRFIEQMAFNKEAPFVSEEQVRKVLSQNHKVKPLPQTETSSHVNLFDVDGVRVGFISARSKPFCSGCNKLRLTQTGELRACLASTTHVNLREIIRQSHTVDDIRAAFLQATKLKPKTGPWTAPAEMWRIGG
jgi:GTP 3',8-cyclase